MDERSFDRMGGVLSGWCLLYAGSRRKAVEYGSFELNVECDIGRLLGSWKGHLGQLSLEHES